MFAIQDLMICNYKAPKIAAFQALGFFEDNKDVKILDTCAGTGLVGGEVNVFFKN